MFCLLSSRHTHTHIHEGLLEGFTCFPLDRQTDRHICPLYGTSRVAWASLYSASSLLWVTSLLVPKEKVARAS